MVNDDNPPVPAGAVSPADLVGWLRALWTWAGTPSEAALRSLIRMRRTPSGFVVEGMPSGTVERVLAGDEPAWEAVEPFVASCLRVGSQSQERIDQDLAAWRDAWYRIVPPRPAGSGAPGAAVPSGALRRLLRRSGWLAGSVHTPAPVDDPYRDPAARQSTGRPPSMPAWRPALMTAAAVAVLFTAGAWAIAGSADHGPPPRPAPAVTRSGAPAAPSASPSPRPPTR